MKRREFITLLGGAAAAWPLAARAQHAGKMWRIAFISQAQQNIYEVLFERLRELGYVEGGDLRKGAPRWRHLRASSRPQGCTGIEARTLP
jgi:hypothetical protein